MNKSIGTDEAALAVSAGVAWGCAAIDSGWVVSAADS